MPHDYLIQLKKIELEVCKARGIDRDVLLQRTRALVSSRARQEVWYRARHELFSTFARLNRIYGYDTQTIRHGIEQFEHIWIRS